LAELYLLSGFVAKDEIERQLLIEFLFDTHIAQGFWQSGGRIPTLRPRAIKRRARPWRRLRKH
jgi:hypothetical protein